MAKQYLKWFFGLLLFVALFVGCQRDIYNFSTRFGVPKIVNSPALVEFIVDPANSTETTEAKQLEKVADYTKLPFATLNKAKFNQTAAIGGNSRVVCITDFATLTDRAIDSLSGFVAKGGTLVVTKAQTDERAMFLLGLKPEADFAIDSIAYGIHFNASLFPDKKGFSTNLDKGGHGGLSAANFNRDTWVLATAKSNKNYPLLLQHTIGKGKVVLWNTNNVLEKSLRGLLFAMVLQGLEGVPYPVANVATIFLDDFPAPLYNLKQEPIKTEMGLTSQEYVQNVWWPDMKAYAKKEDITYTAYAVFDYNTHTIPPFSFGEWESKYGYDSKGQLKERSALIGQDVINAGHEMALHGYNHVSLWKKDWEQPEYMATALGVAAKKWTLSGFKEMPISYVPPSNYIDSIGLVQLYKGMPSIKYIQSTYLGAKEKGGDREFDPDPYVNRFFGYPRISSGYYLEDEHWMNIESLYLFTGIWNHFVHPDDVYQIPNMGIPGTAGHFEYRNKHGLNWYSKNGKKGLFDHFKADIRTFKLAHPMSRFLSATEGSAIVSDWRYSDYMHIETPSEYSISGQAPAAGDDGYFWFCYVSNAKQKEVEKDMHQRGISFDKRSFLDGHLYTINTKGPSVSLPNLGYVPKQKEPQHSRAQLSLLQKEFFAQRAALAPIAAKLENLVAEGNVVGAIAAFEKALQKGVNFSREQWQAYATWLGWENRSNSLWQTLELHYQKQASLKYVQDALALGDQFGFSEMAIQEQWYIRALDWGVKDTAFLESFLQDFNTEANTIPIAQTLEILAAQPETAKVYGPQYIAHILYQKLPGHINSIKELTPCDANYKAMAEDIVWALAEEEQYIAALNWANCTAIPASTLDEWRIKTGDLEKLAKENFPAYLGYLLSNVPDQAFTLLENIPVCREDVRPNATDIAYLYGDKKLYKKALEWANCAKEFPVETQLSWWYELGDDQKMRQLYDAHMSQNPKDNHTRAYMATLLIYRGMTFEAAAIADALPVGKDKQLLKRDFAKDVVYRTLTEKRDFINKYPSLLPNKVKSTLESELRWARGNDVVAEYTQFSDRESNIFTELGTTVSLAGKKNNLHRIKITRTEVFPVNVDEAAAVTQPNAFVGNEKRDLWGLSYGWQRLFKGGSTLGLSAKLEQDDRSDLFYQLGAVLDINKERYFGSFQADWFPVRTGVGYTLGIYQLQLQNGNEFNLSKRLRFVPSWEVNYYDDAEADVLLMNRWEYSFWKKEKFFAGPLLEGAIGWGSINRRSGFPYWMDDQRLYAGAGAVLRLGQDTDKFQFALQAAHYWEKDEQSFESYISNLRYRIVPFGELTAALELFTLEGYNANSLNFGFRYHFK